MLKPFSAESTSPIMGMHFFTPFQYLSPFVSIGRKNSENKTGCPISRRGWVFGHMFREQYGLTFASSIRSRIIPCFFVTPCIIMVFYLTLYFSMVDKNNRGLKCGITTSLWCMTRDIKVRVKPYPWKNGTRPMTTGGFTLLGTISLEIKDKIIPSIKRDPVKQNFLEKTYMPCLLAYYNSS